MAEATIVRPRADWVRVLEAAYAPATDDQSWAAEVVAAVRPAFRCSDGVGMVVVEHDAECRGGQVLVMRGMGTDAKQATVTNADLERLGPLGFRALFYPPAMVTTHSELDPLLAADVRETVRAIRRSSGVPDMAALIVHPEPGVVLVLTCGLDRPTTPTSHDRLLLSQVGLHLESAYRLRRRPEVVKAVLSLTGAPDPRGADVPADLALGARRIELSLTRGGREDASALDLWTALIGGRYSLVSRSENGARHYLVLENDPRSHEMRALSRREIDVLSMAARGLSAKLVSYGLGLSPAAVSSALARAAAKLGLATRMELLRLAATLSHDPRSHAPAATLTAAETEVLALLREGLSNQEIARLRSRSIRTVANQVASLLRKTESGSRRAFVADSSGSAALSAPPPEESNDHDNPVSRTRTVGRGRNPGRGVPRRSA